MPHLRGTQHPKSKLTEQAVRDIRAVYRPGWVSYRDIAERYGVSLQLVSQIVQRQAWTWVDDDWSPQRETPGALGLFFYAPNQEDE